jgi:hypothetical protein
MDFKNIAIDISMRSYIEALGCGDPGITLPDFRDTHDLLCGVDAVVHSALREFLRRETSDEASPDVVEAMKASLAEYEPVYRTLAQ